jgi:zinc protease
MIGSVLRVLAVSALALPAAGLLGCSASSAPGVAASPESPAGAAALPAPDRSQLPAPGPQVTWAPPSPESWKLASGAEVLYGKHGTVPLVALAVVIPRGAETDPPSKAGLTALMGDLLDEGAGGKSALEISERLQALATDLAVVVSIDSTVVSMNLIEENFQPSLELLSDVIRRPAFDAQEFTRRKAQLVAQALASEADPHSGRRVAMYRALFGTGYAGSVPNGTRDTLEAITLADVKAQYARIVAAEGVTFVVTGGIERAKVEEQLGRVFGDWRGAGGATAQALAPSTAAGKLYFVDYPGAAQSVIGLVRRAPGADAPDLFPATVFNRSFGEAFTSRVNMNLREGKGYTYGASSTFQRFRQAGLFGIFSDVRADVTRASLDEVLSELNGLCGARPISAEERDSSVGGLLLGYPGTFERIALLAGRYSQLPIYRRPLDWFETWPRKIESVSREQADEAARAYCDPKQFTIVVAGDKATVASTLDGIGYDWVELDARGRPKMAGPASK